MDDKKALFQDKGFLFALTISGITICFEIAAFIGYQMPRIIAGPFFAAVILIVGREVLKKAMQALFKLNFKSINFLMFIAAVGAFFLKEFEEAAVVITLFTLAEKLEEFGFKTSKDALAQISKSYPEKAILKESNQEVPITSLQMGQIVIVKPSQTIPIDGEIVEGFSVVDESAITGEPIPKDKVKGDKVFAGSRNQNGYMEIRVTHKSSDSVISRIVTLTQEALNNKGETQKFIQKFSGYYTPIVLVLAILLVTVPTLFFGQDFNTWLQTSLSLLVIACPCALVISTPISIYSAMAAASREGALIKGGAVVEELAKIRVVALDKTRTLTLGKPVVSDILVADGQQADLVLACAAGIEVFSEHPIAQSIVERAKKDRIDLHSIKDFESHPGKGASARCLVCNSQKHFLGRLSFIADQHIVPDSISKQVDHLLNQGKTAIVLSNGEKVEGILGVTDEIRSESKNVISQLNALGIETVMLTGDQEGPANQVTKILGIKRVYAGLLPHQKAEIITKLKNGEGQSVAMAGDGVNDAPALATANVGIAMAAVGSDAAIEASSVALMNDRLELIPFLIAIGRRTVSTIKVNTIFALTAKAIVVALALTGHGSLVLAIFADVGVTLVVVLRSLSILRLKV